MQSKAKTVAQYLAELSPDRRQAVEGVRKVIRANLGQGFEEGMQYGMIGYYVPHSVYPAGYHCNPAQPLPFACLASQKNYLSLYLTCIYADPAQRKAFETAWRESGKKLDMGKSCIRFKKLEDLALDVIAQSIARMSVKKYIANYEAALAGGKTPQKAASKAGDRRPTKKRAKAR
jgi:hypothetical protein